MKLLSYIAADGTPRFGAVKGEGVVTLNTLAPTLRALLAVPDGLAQAAALVASKQPDVALSGLTYAPVIPDPDKIICVGLNYHDHVQETGRTVTANPALFARFAGSQIGHGQPLVRPNASDEFDYEAELVVIIGKGGRHIPAEAALAHVAGYSCYNEGSIRDYQRHTSQFLAGKTFAGTGAFGPWMVTADEIPDPTTLTLEGRLNGQVVQHTSVGQMITPIPQLIAYISTVLPLLPGDVIVSGTPGGVGAKRNPPLWMKPGDVAEIEVSGIGILRNPVVQEGAA
ncbi:FAA hydrolase family protein [Rhodovarius crocodyli]|uniref:FAA hydrolase family protein n=1 Tax=Rhodovarius crocodyli TaxID=1979269 RepID=A0A437LXE2_9PROT|nr:fumarylacetoacetate hydrolase family protein [Rhodovarius crocodyli]RVT90075.1 FAA hydrolase family protein [Rhodovarius crocodyli]